MTFILCLPFKQPLNSQIWNLKVVRRIQPPLTTTEGSCQGLYGLGRVLLNNSASPWGGV